MLSLRERAFIATLATSILIVATQAAAAPVSFKTSDGVTIYGDFREAKGEPRATVVLFHMAGSNSGEYAPLVPVLNKAGFATLAIDQRSGGRLWGQDNRTVAAGSKPYDFADAIPDLEAAIAYAETKTSAPVAVWGSSYSAALVFIAAARHPDVKALLAFSPAEYIQGTSIEASAAQLRIPVFVTSTPDVNETESAEALSAAVPDHRAEQYIPRYGVHGSSTLRFDQNPSGAKENWKSVMTFLDAVFRAR